MTAMRQPESKSPSRRALLAGALGGIGAWAASAIGRLNEVHATNGDFVTVGNSHEATATTSIYWGAGETIRGNTLSGVGVYGNAQAGAGVHGNAESGVGVEGHSESNIGVYGSSSSGIGVRGSSSSDMGVNGFSSSNIGVEGFSLASAQPATVGHSVGNSTGVQGYSGTGSLPGPRPKTGVYGYANQDSASTGTFGWSPLGVGVRGKTTSGYAGYFEGRVYTSAFYELGEVATPAGPLANRARLFVRDNGAGKTQLCVRFHTGGVHIIKTEL
jgi:hypothetical protein